MSVIPISLAGRSLSTRELQILQMHTEGCTKPAMAERLYIAVSTVRTLNQNLFAKLGVNSAAEAVSAGYRLGYLAVAPELTEDLAVVRAAREQGYQLAVVRTAPDGERSEG